MYIHCVTKNFPFSACLLDACYSCAWYRNVATSMSTYIWKSKRPKDFISSGLTCFQLKNSFVKTATLTLEVWHVFLCITLLLKSSLHTVPIKAFLLLHLMQIQDLELSINTLWSARKTKGWDNISSSMEMETNSRFFLCIILTSNICLIPNSAFQSFFNVFTQISPLLATFGWKIFVVKNPLGGSDGKFFPNTSFMRNNPPA